MSNLLMFFVAPYAILFGMGTLLLDSVGGFKNAWDAAAVAPFALLALSSGLDLTRIAWRGLVALFPALGQREIGGRAIILLGLALVPLPTTVVFYLGHLIAPQHMGIVVGLGTAYKLAMDLAIVAGVLKLLDISLSIRTMVTRFREQIALDIGQEFERPVPPMPPMPPLPPEPYGGGEPTADRDDHLHGRRW